MKKIISDRFLESASVKQSVASDETLLNLISIVADRLRSAIKNGGTLYSCGNGGSCCDAMHLTEELVARYKKEREGFRAMCFSDPGGITCWANDYDYNSLFARYAKTFCTEKDVLFGFTTSGNSKNIIEAVKVAKEKGTFTVALTGKDGGLVKDIADISLIIPSDSTARIQESHITIVHILCELLEA